LGQELAGPKFEKALCASCLIDLSPDNGPLRGGFPSGLSQLL
jgi:hypothetical protein